jgi:Transposase IS200 like
VSQVVGFIKGKGAIHMARVYGERKRIFVGQHFWARGFFVNTVGRDPRVHPQSREGRSEARDAGCHAWSFLKSYGSVNQALDTVLFALLGQIQTALNFPRQMGQLVLVILGHE